MHFEAAAQYRLSQEDLEKSRYGHEIGRLKVAEGLAKKGLDAKKGVAEAVVADLKVSCYGVLLFLGPYRLTRLASAEIPESTRSCQICSGTSRTG